jgi:quinol monooxygenase YgiN
MSAKSFIAQLRTRPEKRADMIALQSELKQLVFEHEPDALVYEFFQSESDPDLFQVVATFRDDAAYEKHMHIDFHDRLVPGILDCVTEDMKLDFYRSLS